MEKNILIEEQDEVLRLIDQKELDEIEASAEEFDGFTGIRIVGRVQPEVMLKLAELESIQYLNKMRELINLGDGININARLLILRRKIIDDVESLSKSKISA